MAFEKEITLENCLYSYAISDNIKNTRFVIPHFHKIVLETTN